ncbi:MAG: signal peptide peptidase SppA [Victivallales bacterium]|nr:signal peptide peptidase SppA [Victivallales bacterium]
MEKRDSTEKPETKRKIGCLFFIMAFLSSCFIGVVLLAILIYLLVSGMLNKMTEKPLNEKRFAFKQSLHSGKADAENKIALIKIQGIILNSSQPWETVVNADKICKKLKAVKADENIKAVIIKIDSPGGEITATDKIYHNIQRIKKNGKPVAAFLGSVAASGGYYVVAGTDYIVANRLTTTGSIGVIVNSFNFHKLLEKIGVTDEVYESGRMKDILNPARPRTAEEKKIIQNLVDESYNEFVKIVSKGRISKAPKLTASYIKKSVIGDGRIFSGAQALKLGLVDKLGYLEDAEKEAAKMAGLTKNEYKIIEYKEQVSILDLFQKIVNKNLCLRVNIKSLNRYTFIEPGKMYYLYTGF